MKRLLLALALSANCAVYAADEKPRILVFDKGEQLLVELIEKNQRTEWRRNLHCAESPEQMKTGYGEVVSLMGYKEGDFLFEDYDCNGKVDWYSEFGKGVCNRDDENKEKFERADNLFRQGKNKIKEYADLDKILEKWLNKKKEKK